jgi:hypothetical protein
MPPTAITRKIFYRGSEQRPFLLPPRFRDAPDVEAAPRRAGQNRCVDNELAGAPVRIKPRTPTPLKYSFNFALSQVHRMSGFEGEPDNIYA